MTDEKKKNENTESENAPEYVIDDDSDIYGTAVTATLTSDGSIVEYVEPDGTVRITIRMEKKGGAE